MTSENKPKQNKERKQNINKTGRISSLVQSNIAKLIIRYRSDRWTPVVSRTTLHYPGSMRAVLYKAKALFFILVKFLCRYFSSPPNPTHWYRFCAYNEKIGFMELQIKCMTFVTLVKDRVRKMTLLRKKSSSPLYRVFVVGLNHPLNRAVVESLSYYQIVGGRRNDVSCSSHGRF